MLSPLDVMKDASREHQIKRDVRERGWYVKLNEFGVAAKPLASDVQLLDDTSMQVMRACENNISGKEQRFPLPRQSRKSLYYREARGSLVRN